MKNKVYIIFYILFFMNNPVRMLDKTIRFLVKLTGALVEEGLI